MTSVWIGELRGHVGETVTVRGWVVTTRSSGKIAFVVLRDGTGTVQGVLSKKEVSDQTWGAFGALTQEASVAMTGMVRDDPRSPGGVELSVTGLDPIGASPDYPISPKEHGTTFLFEHRHLWLRTRRQVALARLRHEVEQGIRDYFYQEGFTLVDTPILTGAIGEEAGNLFATDYFDLGQGLPGADRPAVRGSCGRCPRKGVLLRAHLPGREVEDAPPPDRILDGRARGGVQRLRCQHAAAGILRELHRGTRARSPQGGVEGVRARYHAARAGGCRRSRGSATATP